MQERNKHSEVQTNAHEHRKHTTPRAILKVIEKLVFSNTQRTQLMRKEVVSKSGWCPAVSGFGSTEIQAGAKPCSAFKVIKRILKSILKFTGSRCSEAKLRVTWDLRSVLVVSRAAAFLTNLSRATAVWLNLLNKIFDSCNLTKVWLLKCWEEKNCIEPKTGNTTQCWE